MGNALAMAFMILIQFKQVGKEAMLSSEDRLAKQFL